MSSDETKTAATIPLTSGLLMVMLCLIWGANAVSIRISNQDLPPLLTATIRSVVASGLLWLYARLKGQPVFFPAGGQIQALVIGLLFGIGFLFVYWGLSFTPASRGIIFLYTFPFLAALGAHFFLPDDRLTPTKLAGLALAFAGIVAVFCARSPRLPPGYWIGDLMQVAAAIFWVATNIYIKRTIPRFGLHHYQTLFAQLFYSIPVLAGGALLLDRGHPFHPTSLALGSLAFQCLVVAFFSYVLFFWLLHRFPLSRLASFTFLSPLFGVILGATLLSEPVTPLLWLGLAPVGAGIYLVNRPPAGRTGDG